MEWRPRFVFLVLLLAWKSIDVGATYRESISRATKGTRHSPSKFRLALHRPDGANVPHHEETGRPSDPFSVRRKISSTSIQEKIAKVDFSKLKPDDPRFMLMPWPKIHGPAAQAYGRHFAWKRRLSDTERKFFTMSSVLCTSNNVDNNEIGSLCFSGLRWEQWAIYQLSNEDHDPFQFQLEDYAKQHQWKALEENTARLISKGEQSAGEQVAKRLEELRRQETEDVLRAMKAYYEAFNKKNMEHLLSFWLPNDQSELTLPGVPKMVRFMLLARACYPFSLRLLLTFPLFGP